MLDLIKVEDLTLSELQVYHTLRDNAFDETNSFVADSPKVVNLLLQSDVEVRSILATKEYYKEHEELVASKEIDKLYVADKKVLESLVGHKIHHNCMMHGTRVKESSLDELGDGILMLDEITSTENIGSIARSMAALGVDSYLLGKKSPHPYGRRALRVSMGYISHLKYKIYDEIIPTCQELQKRGYKIFAAEVCEGSTPLWHVGIPDKWVLVMGHEGKGLSQEVLDVCDEVVTIEMQEGVKSFNVAVAASIMMYRFKR